MTGDLDTGSTESGNKDGCIVPNNVGIVKNNSRPLVWCVSYARLHAGYWMRQ